MRKSLCFTSHLVGAALLSVVLASCGEPEVVESWEAGEHDVAIKVDTLEDGTTRVKASYGLLGEETLEDLKAKAEEGSVDAAMALAVLYWSGAGPKSSDGQKTVPANKEKALGYYRLAAVKDHVPAQLILADLYASGEGGIEQNLAEARRLYGEAAESGEVRAKCRLAALYDANQSFERDALEAAKLYQACAKTGDGAAMLRLAELYATGEGVSENKVAAVEWYRKAAQANQPRAHCRLAVMYDKGQGVLQDTSEAVKLYRLCAESGDGPAMVRLAQLYEKGEGVSGDSAEAVSWYLKAANANQTQAQCRLAALYDSGDGVKQDPAEAVKWYKLCAESGAGPALFRLAEIHAKGLASPNDPGLAADYMLRALKANSEQAKDEMLGGAKTWSQAFREEFQRKLKAENLYAGKIDGILGSGTKRAIEALTSDES